MPATPDVHIEQHSQGSKNVVFIHGYGEFSQMWDDTVNTLCKSETDYSIFTLDLPGFGMSPLSESINSLKQVSDLVKESFQKIGIEKAYFAGHSLGGYVLMHLIAYHKELVDGACFINSSVFSDSDSKKHQRNKVIAFLEKNGTEKFIGSFIPGLFYQSNIASCQKEISMAIEQGKTVSVETMIRYMEFMRDREDLSSKLNSFNKPVHFIIGKNDESVPFELSSPQISIPPLATALILEDCGHMAMFEKREAYFSSLYSFLDI